MMTEVKVSDFTKYPGPRFKRIGKGSGEEFREEVLWPAYQLDTELEVDLDGTAGYGSSFLEEAFGGLIRNHHLSKSDVRYLMSHLKSEEDKTLIEEIQDYMQDALDGNS